MAGPTRSLVAIVPCRDIEASTRFYARLGLKVQSDYGRYRILADGTGLHLHLTSEAPTGWLDPTRNPNGLYLYIEEVDRLAATLTDLLHGHLPERKPWGMYEFAVSDPDGTLVRVGWPLAEGR